MKKSLLGGENIIEEIILDNVEENIIEEIIDMDNEYDIYDANLS